MAGVLIVINTFYFHDHKGSSSAALCYIQMELNRGSLF